MKEITFTQAAYEALDEEMARDPFVFLFGEDIGEHWGGLWGQFTGLFEKYGPQRIRETPISETAILGGAIGAAATGMRPVASMMFVDFIGVCGDELLNQLQMRYMFGGKIKLPLL
jgi:pyruvate dehydrogenase E1 component beta subunit